MTDPRHRHCGAGEAVLHCGLKPLSPRLSMLDVSATDQKSFADGKILKKITDGVGIVTFNSPEKRNAMSLEMWEGVGQALTELREDDHVRVVILTGAGDKAFMSGAEISQSEKPRHNAQASEEYNRKSEAQRAVLAHFPKPTIACIRGFCLGGGMQVAMSADMRFAYGYDGLKHLVSLVGPSQARLLMYTGIRIDSAEALRIGLVDRVIADGKLWDETLEIARTISGNAPLSIKASKLTIAQVLKDKDEREMAAIKEISTACMDSEDFREGRQAFMEKRKPKFKGR